jgi:hypothetical protein
MKAMKTQYYIQFTQQNAVAEVCLVDMRWQQECQKKRTDKGRTYLDRVEDRQSKGQQEGAGGGRAWTGSLPVMLFVRGAGQHSFQLPVINSLIY